MKIIKDLEPVRRSVYCGAIGYLSLTGEMDTSIAIRTLLLSGDRMHCRSAARSSPIRIRNPSTRRPSPRAGPS